jgi:YbbR domain-containing protein
VRPALEGRPAPGYEVLNVVSEPATVEVVGPESSLRGLDEAMTEPVSIANEKRPLREVVNVGVADPTVRLRSPQTASVTVQIGPGTTTRTLSGVPVMIVNADERFKVTLLTPTVSLTVTGTRDATEELTANNVRAQAEVGGLPPGDHSVNVDARVEAGLTVESITPRAVRLRISKP